MIVTVTPTVMDGQVVRWYRSEGHEDSGIEAVSASRNGVQISGFLHNVEDILPAARAACETLRRGGDVRHLATHRRRGMRGPLEPIERSTEEKTDTPEVTDVPT